VAFRFIIPSKRRSIVENSPADNAHPDETLQGIYIFRNSLKEARLKGDTIELYNLDGTPAGTEPVTTVRVGDVLEIYDKSGNKIGSQQLPGEDQKTS
jgi:hypothetical protein